MARVIVSLLVAVALVIAWIGARNRHRFRYKPGTLDAPQLAQLAAAGFTAHEVEVEPGIVLRGLVRVPDPGAKDWLLFLGGNGGGLLESGRNLGRALAADAGWGVAAWAYRGFDGSGGRSSAAAFAADCEKLWMHLQTEFGADPARIHLVSFSLGTALALHVAGVATARGVPPPSLVLLAPYERIQVTQDVWWAPWSFADDYDALAHARSSPSPALVVYGTRDDAFPPGTAPALAAALGSRARLLELPGRGHTGWLEDDAVLSQVRSFLRENAP